MTSESEGWSESEGVTSTCSWSQILRSRSYALVSQRIKPNLSKETRPEISIQRNETRSLLVEWVAKQIWDIRKKAVTWGLVGEGLPQILIHFEPQNVILFENRIFTDIIS